MEAPVAVLPGISEAPPCDPVPLVSSSAASRAWLADYPWTRRALGLSLALVLLALGYQARSSLDEERDFRRSLAKVPTIAPEAPPEIGQDSIDLAMVLYGIEVPKGVTRPEFDRELHDRGMTTRGAFFGQARVTIGPAAFTSWGLLGSTLAHELEVHCRQNFLAIYLLDLVGLDGTGEAERQAYAHELKQARRFGLDIPDAEMIAETMNFYYPEKPRLAGLAFPERCRLWLASSLLRRGTAP